MEVAAFVPMVILLLLVLRHCNCHLLEYSQVTTEKDTNDGPKIVLIQNSTNSISFIIPLVSLVLNAFPLIIQQFTSQKTVDKTPKIPTEFEGRNPCVDWILVRQKYPGSDCHFYQCELHQPVKPVCKLQTLVYMDYGVPSSSFDEEKSPLPDSLHLYRVLLQEHKVTKKELGIGQL